MKGFVFLILSFVLLSTNVNGQGFSTELVKKSSLDVDLFIGIDDFENLYYVKDNILYKKNSKRTCSYSNIELGELKSVNIQNPFKIILFYADFNAAIILDNNLNELTQKIDFTKETLYNNVSFIAGASQNNLWLYANDNKLHLYDYQGRKELFQTQPMTFYDPKFKALDIVGTYKKLWILSENSILEFNEYGVFINAYNSLSAQQGWPFKKGFIFLNKTQFYYQEPESQVEIPLTFEGSIQSVSVNSSNIFIFDENLLYQYQIKQ